MILNVKWFIKSNFLNNLLQIKMNKYGCTNDYNVGVIWQFCDTIYISFQNFKIYLFGKYIYIKYLKYVMSA